MKTWQVTFKIVQDLERYGCYCNEDPYELITSPEYEDELLTIYDDLYTSYGYLYDEELTDEDTEDWSDDDWDDYYNEKYNDFMDMIGIESREVDEDEISGLDILIDERECDNLK